MSHNPCMARLLASAVHDMRNILAIIRESAGLAQDLAQLAKGGDSDRAELSSSLDEVRRQVLLAVQLAEGLEFIAQADMAGDAASCDLARICSLFCRMAARQARAARIRLANGQCGEPVWAATPSMDVFQALLDVLDLCVSVGGKVELELAAGQQGGNPGIVLRVAGGDNAELALSAMTGSSAPGGRSGKRQANLLPGLGPGSFFLAWQAREEA